VTWKHDNIFVSYNCSFLLLKTLSSDVLPRWDNSTCSSQNDLLLSVCAFFVLVEYVLIFHPDPADRGISPNVGYQSKVRVIDRYKVIGFISSGTYGRVYKAVGRHGQTGEFAIKKFKPGVYLTGFHFGRLLTTIARQGRRADPIHRHLSVSRPGNGPLFRAQSCECHQISRDHP
jgi:hypothetical protein